MKKIISIVSIFMFALVLFGQGVSAEESTKFKFSDSEKEQLEKNFSELGIDKDTQIKLINKLENGEVLDSMKEENLRKVSAEMQKNEGLNDYTVITFEDGSKLAYGSEVVNTDGIQPMKHANGNYTIKSSWTWGFVSFSFYSDIVLRTGYDYIVKSYNPNVTVIGGSKSDEKVTIERKYETATKRAYSRMDFNYSLPTGSSSMDLFFQVGNNDWETTLTLKDSK